METSLRYTGDSNTLRIYAKEKYPLDSTTYLQVHGELDTRLGAPTQLGAMIRHFYPASLNSYLSAILGVGLQYNKKEKIRYHVRGKMKYAVTSDDKLNFHVKGRCEVDPEFRQKKYGGAAEFTWFIPNFKNDQDVRLKVGYEILDKVPYMQIRENNWTLNANVNGRWNLRYDL